VFAHDGSIYEKVKAICSSLSRIQDSGFRDEEIGKWKIETVDLGSKFPFSIFQFPFSSFRPPAS
jgi:hypothetical protein